MAETAHEGGEALEEPDQVISPNLSAQQVVLPNRSVRHCLLGGGGTRACSSTLFTPRKALRGGITKSIFKRPFQFWAINAHKMAPRTTQWLQERHCDAPTKGLAWYGDVRVCTRMQKTAPEFPERPKGFKPTKGAALVYIAI